MKTILNEKEYNFKTLEKEIFRVVCLIAIELTRTILECKDQEIFESADKKMYKSEGLRKTGIKTQYGTVEYKRRVYKIKDGEEKGGHVYLLDRELKIEKIGLVSENLAGIIADFATEESYREAANAINNTTGIDMSAQGIWNVLQRIGEKIDDEEYSDVRRMKANHSEGTRCIPVLFEEMDGVWIKRQGKKHEKMPMQEVKVSTTYEGWDAEKEKENRSTLVGKHILAGIEKSRDFHEKREADIHKRYDADEIKQRIVNGDGGTWIGEPNDPDAIVQLDQFHVHKEIKRLIKDKTAVTEIEKYFVAKDIDGMMSCVQKYADSIKNDAAALKNANKLISYLSSNKAILIPWQERDLPIPEAPDGIIYKGMGVQENQNCTVITLRMKHRKMRWSKSGGNNMAKVLAKKANKELHQTIAGYSDQLFYADEIREAIENFSASKAPKKDGNGSSYLDLWNAHMPINDYGMTEGMKILRAFTR